MTALRSAFFLMALLDSVLLFGQNSETFKVPVEYYKVTRPRFGQAPSEMAWRGRECARVVTEETDETRATGF
jgi:hypothetical protein